MSEKWVYITRLVYLFAGTMLLVIGIIDNESMTIFLSLVVLGRALI